MCVDIDYKYDALGRLVKRIKGSQWTKYTYDGDDVVLDTKSDGTQVYYGNGPGIDNKLWYEEGSAYPVYFLTDHLGSTCALVSHTGSIIPGTQIDYDSFGVPSTTIPTRFQYAGREYDPDTELYYYRARWYDPVARRFISEDPIGLDGGINLYGYVRNNPINSVDPLGLQDITPIDPSSLEIIGPPDAFEYIEIAKVFYYAAKLGLKLGDALHEYFAPTIAGTIRFPLHRPYIRAEVRC